VAKARTRPETGKDGLRQEILDAARELFVHEGYGNVSLRKIARQIGYTPMSIYLHFKDKAAILDCICEETFTGYQRTSERLDRRHPDPADRLQAGLRAFIEFGLAHPYHYQLTFMTPPPRGESLSDRRKEIGQQAYQRFQKLIAACLSPCHQGDLDTASQVVWSSIHGLVSLLLAKPDFPWQSRRRLIAGVVASSMNWLRCRPEAALAAPERTS
jgi:AcrR family transcriptional regulator